MSLKRAHLAEDLPVSDEELVLQDLLARQVITAAQADEALEIYRSHKTPMLDILGALNYIRPRDYADSLAQITQKPMVSQLLDTESLDYDVELIRRFDVPLMARYLFCPLQNMDGVITVLTNNPAEARLTEWVQAVVPGAEVLPLVGTELDIKYLLSHAFHDQLMHTAVNALRDNKPEQSASKVFTRPQLLVAALILLLIVIGLALDFWTTASALIVIISLLYVVGIAFKFVLSLVGMFNRDRRVTHDQAEALEDADLPIYSILVPVYKEPSVVPNLLRALANIDYPHEKLDVLILMESDDSETINAAKAARPPSYFRFIIVPDSLPRTKPKACNYGLNFCRGEFVTIYDAEDVPEVDQLRKAVAAFRNGPDNLICVQSALNYFNADENYLTRMFTLEYTFWFDYMLPGLDRMGLPIPLGGTSNHFRMDLLRKLGAWDPHNVTEDADLGIRATVNGYTVGVINSTTYEEANKATGNWIRQRSRWIKGYMQTWLVHNRHPLQLLRAIGLKNWLSYQLLIGGTFWVFLINPIMWFFFLIWILFQPAWMSSLFHDWVWQIAFINLIVGNGIAIVLSMLASLSRPNYRHLFFFALTNAIYWMLHSIAAYKGLWQLIRNPFYWEKTTHGLTNVNVHEATTPQAQQSVVTQH